MESFTSVKHWIKWLKYKSRNFNLRTFASKCYSLYSLCFPSFIFNDLEIRATFFSLLFWYIFGSLTVLKLLNIVIIPTEKSLFLDMFFVAAFSSLFRLPEIALGPVVGPELSSLASLFYFQTDYVHLNIFSSQGSSIVPVVSTRRL